MKNLPLTKKNLTFFIFILFTLTFPSVNAQENTTHSEVYVPELMDDGSVVFTKKATSDLDQPADPAIKLRGTTVKCCADIPIRTPGGTTVIKVCREFPAGTQCPPGSQ